MQTVQPQLIFGKKVLLRLDIDVPIEEGKVAEDFRLKAGLPTLKLCLEHAHYVVILGHLGRPEGTVMKSLSVEPIYNWLVEQGFASSLENGKLKILENLRFEEGEEKADLEYAKQLAGFGDFFVNEAFASYHPAASTTVLPTLLPHAAGLRFAQEVEKLTEVLHHPQRPMIAIIGGAKVEDKLPVIKKMSQLADIVLIGGKLAGELKDNHHLIGEHGHKVAVAQLNEEGTDITPATVQAWTSMVAHTRMIIWNGPVGKIENQGQENLGSARGTYELAQVLSNSEAEVIIGGGDTVAALDNWDMLDKFSFVSTGGGAMLKFFIDGTLPTIDALK